MSETIDVEKVVAVIKAEDDLIANEYVGVDVCDSPGHCAIGALLFAAGVPNERLNEIDGPEEWFGKDEDIADTLRNAYGLHRWHALEIIHANDDAQDSRPAAVIARVRGLAEDQRLMPAKDRARCETFDVSHDPDEDV